MSFSQFSAPKIKRKVSRPLTIQLGIHISELIHGKAECNTEIMQV